MDMNLCKYLAFVRTVEYGSFTKAAELLNYSQSGISRMINDQETDWGVTLLERGEIRRKADVGWNAAVSLCKKSVRGIREAAHAH